MNARDLPIVHSLRASISALPRRVNHGGAAWLRRRGDALRQPQDGASEAALGEHDKSLGEQAAALSTASSLQESEDARITGGTRCLMRRLMGLNVAPAGAELRSSPPLPWRRVFPA